MTDPVPPEMRVEIGARLRHIAAEPSVTIVLAVETGSRAWGFSSPGSDDDVRFVNVEPAAWHLTAAPGRDVIERPIDAGLDLSGGALRKALGLMHLAARVLRRWTLDCDPSLTKGMP